MDYTKMDDNQILALGRAGEDEATEFLLQKYGYLVKREVRTVYLIGAETEDLAQEGMIGLFKAIRDYSPDKAPAFPPLPVSVSADRFRMQSQTRTARSMCR